MNNYIGAALVLIILLVFVPQAVLQVQNHNLISECEAIVEEAKEAAKHEGCFTTTIVNNMNQGFEDLGLDVSDINETYTSTVKYRENAAGELEYIDYKIVIPIERAIAAGRLFGIDDSVNRYTYVFEGSVGSEKLYSY